MTTEEKVINIIGGSVMLFAVISIGIITTMFVKELIGWMTQ